MAERGKRIFKISFGKPEILYTKLFKLYASFAGNFVVLFKLVLHNGKLTGTGAHGTHDICRDTEKETAKGCIEREIAGMVRGLGC